MSLKVWLPLIENFNNQGTYINNPTNSGATVSTSGPLGGSYSFDGTNDQIQTTYLCAENTMSVCMWVNFSKIGVHLLDMRNSSGSGYQPAYVSTSGIQVGGSSNNQWPYISYSFSTGTWYHLAIVYSSSKTEVYINGSSIGSSTSSVGYNYNTTMEVHLGSRYSGANWFQGYVSDFRIYNEALSAYEVKVISRGLLLHYMGSNKSVSVGGIIQDSSGYNRNSTVYTGSFSNTGTGNISRYGGRAWDTGSSGAYSSTTSPSSMTKTICFWFMINTKTNSTVFFADYKSKMGFGFNGSGYIIPSCDSLSVPMYTTTNPSISGYQNYFIVLRKNSGGTDIDLFINGIKQTTRGSNNYWTHSTDTLMIGQRSTGSPMANAKFNDFRMYSTILSDGEILELYNTQLKQLSSGKSNPFELVEDTSLSRVKIIKSGQLKNAAFVESTTGNKFKSTQVISNEFIER